MRRTARCYEHFMRRFTKLYANCAWRTSFLTTGVCIFIVSNALLISSATVIVRAGGAICLNPSATVLFSVCSVITVECFVPVLHGCVWYVCCYVRKKAIIQCLCNY